MNKKKYEGLNLFSDNLNDALKIWAEASISLIDIRHKVMYCNDVVNQYIMPANTFIFTNGGKATVILNNTVFNVERHGVFHGGKGTEISIYPASDWLEYYMVLYKTGEPAFYKSEFISLMGRSNPFKQQYGFSTDNPIFFLEKLKKMHEKWKEPTPLHLFFGKACFYELIYEIYCEVENKNIQVLEADFTTMAKSYLDKHYNENISIHMISSILGVSDSHLRRSFKKQYGKSPQEYLTSIRLNAAKEILLRENFPVHRVAEACGFSDEFNFSKLFSKHIGMSPSKFRLKTSKYMSDNNMDNLFFSLYNEKSLVSIDKHNGEGEFSMFKQIKSKTVIAAALSLMLLLTACSNGPANTSNQDKEQFITKQEQGIDTEEGTRIVSTVMGEVEVPVNPKRVVVDYVIGDVIALGVVPVGVRSVFEGSAFGDVINDATSIEKWDPEEIMTLEPDLIISVVKDEFEASSKIAPTVFIPFTEMSMEERVTFLGEVLNRQTEAEKAIREYYQKVEEAKVVLEQQGILDKKISIFFGDPTNVLVAGDKWGRGGDIIYNDLGFKAPDVIQSEIIGGDQYRDLSLEVLPQYVGDYIVFDWDPKLFEQSTIWNSIPAYAEGRTIALDFGLFFYNDVYSQSRQLDFIVDNLLSITGNN